jgi:hypothetical protein
MNFDYGTGRRTTCGVIMLMSTIGFRITDAVALVCHEFVECFDLPKDVVVVVVMSSSTFDCSLA